MEWNLNKHQYHGVLISGHLGLETIVEMHSLLAVLQRLRISMILETIVAVELLKYLT